MISLGLDDCRNWAGQKPREYVGSGDSNSGLMYSWEDCCLPSRLSRLWFPLEFEWPLCLHSLYNMSSVCGTGVVKVHIFVLAQDLSADVQSMFLFFVGSVLSCGPFLMLALLLQHLICCVFFFIFMEVLRFIR